MTELGLRHKVGHWTIWQSTYSKISFWALTMLLFSQSAMLFRAEDLNQSTSMFVSLFNSGGGTMQVPKLETLVVVLSLSGLFAVHWQLRHRPLREVVDALPLPVVTLLGTLAILSIAVVGGTSDEFIYFQF